MISLIKLLVEIEKKNERDVPPSAQHDETPAQS